MSEKTLGLLSFLLSVALIYSLRDVPTNPRLFPLALLIFLGATGIALFFRKISGDSFVLGKSLFAMLHYGLFIAYIVFVPIAGFAVSTAIFLTIAIIALKYRRPVYVAGGIAVGAALCLQYFFSGFFGLPLP